MQVCQETHLVFVDLQKAYDSIPLMNLFQVLEESPIQPTIIKAIKSLYDNAESRIKIGTLLSRHFRITKGLRQGCNMSPLLFNIYLDTALKNWRRKCSGMGIPINEKILFTLHYADDQIVLAQDSEDAEYMMRKLHEEL